MIPPPTVPTYRGPGCPRCKVPMTVDFHLANCVNPHCGKFAPCQCPARGRAPEPYDMTIVQAWYWNGAPAQITKTFCRGCGDELRAP